MRKVRFRFISLLTGTLVLIVVAGQGCLNNLAPDSDGAATTTNGFTTTTDGTYTTSTEARVNVESRFAAEIENMEEEWQELEREVEMTLSQTGEISQNWWAQIEQEIEARVQAAKNDLTALRSAGADSWNQLKINAETSLNAFEEAMLEARIAAESMLNIDLAP